MMIIHECEQGTPEWYAVRCGKITASNFDRVMAGEKTSKRRLYIRKVAAERLSGEIEESYVNEYMLRGKALEGTAREYYKLRTGHDVREIGFAEYTSDIGGSPDGLVGDDGGLEIKCVLGSTHIETIDSGTIPSQYIPQVQGLMWVTNRYWWDYMSFCPGIKARPDFVVRVDRDDNYIKKLVGAAFKANKEIRALCARVTEPEF